MNARHPWGVFPFSIKNIFHDKMDLKLFVRLGLKTLVRISHLGTMLKKFTYVNSLWAHFRKDIKRFEDV